MRLVAASCVGAGEIEEASGKRTCLVHAADEEQGLAQLGEHEGMEEQRRPVATRSSTWSRSGRASAARPARAYAAPKMAAVRGTNSGMLAALAERQAPFEHGDRGVESPWRR